MSDKTEHTENDIALAGEYVLGLMSADESAAFQARMAHEPQLKDLVSSWGEDFGTLTDDIDPVAPPAQIKTAIQTRLFGPKKRGFWGMLAALFTSKAGSYGIITAVTLVAFLAFGPNVNFTGAGPIYTANLSAADSSLVVNARFDQAASALQIERLAGGAKPGRSLQLWLIAEGSSTPVPLGLLSAEAVATHNVPTELHAALASGTLAISDEPLGGSPTGLPTGEILAAAAVSKI